MYGLGKLGVYCLRRLRRLSGYSLGGLSVCGLRRLSCFGLETLRTHGLEAVSIYGLRGLSVSSNISAQNCEQHVLNTNVDGIGGKLFDY